jgi:hypothetical protein
LQFGQREISNFKVLKIVLIHGKKLWPKREYSVRKSFINIRIQVSNERHYHVSTNVN